MSSRQSILILSSLLAGACLGAVTTGSVVPALAQDGSYRQPMLVQSFEIKAAVPTNSSTVESVRNFEPNMARGPALESATKLAAEVAVVVKRFRSRAIEPVL